MPTKASVSILIGAELGSSFRGSFTSAGKQLSTLGQAIKTTSDRAGQIEAYRRSKRVLDDLSVAYSAAKQKVALLSAEIAKSDKPTKELQSNLRKAQKELDRTKKAFVESGQASRRMGKELRDTGIDTKNLAAENLKLGKTLETLKKQQQSLQGIENAKAANKAKRADYRAQMVDAVALGAALYGTIKPAVDFEYAMAKVGAITGEAANSDGFKRLTSLARELGRTTQYTASQVADAMQYLGMAGFSTEQIMAALPATLNLAVVENMDMGQAADITSNILTGFALSADETARAVDVLAEASRATNVSVTTLGDTMKYVAPAAASVGGTLEETATLAGILGDAGIQGTMAGTMLRSAYLRLAAPAKSGAAALERMGQAMGMNAEELPEVAKEAALAQAQLGKMGVSVFDGEGKMRSLVDIIKDMGSALKDATDQEKLAAVKAVFGERTATGALALFKHADTGRLDEVLTKVKNSAGAADEMANRLKNTTLGAFKEFTSAVESIGISLGSVLLPALSDAARGLAAVATGFSAFAEKHPTLIRYLGLAATGLIGLKIGAIALGYGFTFITGGVLNVIGIFAKLRTGVTLLRLGMAPAWILNAGKAFVSFGGTLMRFAGTAIPAVITGIKAVGLAIVTNPIGAAIAAIAVGAGLIVYYWEPIKKFFGTLWDGIKEGAASAWEYVGKVIGPIQKVKDLIGSAWNKLFGKDEQPTAANDNRKIGDAVKTDAGRNIDAMNAKARDTIRNQSSNSSTVNALITVNAASGMDEKKIAQEVQRALAEQERKAGQRKRAANYD